MCLQKNDADSFLYSDILIMELAMSKIGALYFNCLNWQPENIKIYDLSKVQIEGGFWSIFSPAIWFGVPDGRILDKGIYKDPHPIRRKANAFWLSR